MDRTAESSPRTGETGHRNQCLLFRRSEAKNSRAYKGSQWTILFSVLFSCNHLLFYFEQALAPAKPPVVPSNELLVVTSPPSDTNVTNSAFTSHVHGNNVHPHMNRSLLSQRQQATNPLSSHPSYYPANSASRRAFDESQRAPKRRKGSDRVVGLSEPSLLSRLHSSSPPQLVQTFHASLDDDGPPGGEWSIKGAAQATGARFPSRLSAETQSQSLLDRLQDVSSRTFTEDTFISSDPGKRKRGTF